MLIAGAVCPHPPLLIPAALGAAADQPPASLRTVAAAAGDAVAGLVAAAPDLIAVVGGGQAEREHGPRAAGSLQGYGVAVTVGEGPPVLPLSLTVGRWLLERAGLAALTAGAAAPPVPLTHPAVAAAPPVLLTRRAAASGTAVLFQEVDEHAPASVCRKLGAVLAQRAPRVALLAMGDGSARRARDAPGAPDPQAQGYDEAVARALAAADAGWLGRLDPALDRELMVAGRAAWQVLAGAAEGRRLLGRLLCVTAPYGVTYLVASWQRR